MFWILVGMLLTYLILLQAKDTVGKHNASAVRSADRSDEAVKEALRRVRHGHANHARITTRYSSILSNYGETRTIPTLDE